MYFKKNKICKKPTWENSSYKLDGNMPCKHLKTEVIPNICYKYSYKHVNFKIVF